MKKIFSKLMLVAFAALTFVACEDVPEPYDIPGTGTNALDNGVSEGTYLSETFASGFGSFTNVTVKGLPWIIDYKTAKATGYADGNTEESEAYLVSKAVDLSQSEKAYLEFDYILRYVRAGSTQNKVLITSEYSGDPTTTSWIDITGTLVEGSDWNTFYKYQMNLPTDFIGQSAVVVALYYSCTSTSATIEIKNLKLLEGEVNATPTPGPDEETIGTKDSPLTVAEALTQINALNDKGKSANKAYVKGKVVKVTTNQTNFDKYGNLNYYISDDGNDANTIQVYAGDGLNGEKFKSIKDIAAGDEVVVLGTLYKFVNNSGNVIPEIEGSYIVSLTKGDTPQPSGETIGTAENPISVASALEQINALNEKGKSANKAYVKGKVVKVTTNQTNFDKYGNLNYYISDDGNDANTIQVYAGDGLNGEKFKSIKDIAAGDEVVVLGTLYKFVNNSGNVIPEIEGSYIVSLTKGSAPVDPPTPTESNLQAGKYFFVYTGGTSVQVGKPVEAGKDYGYMYLTDAKMSDGTLADDADNLFTFTATDGGFTIQDASGRYYYMDDSHNSFQVSATMPTSNHIWSANVDSNGEATVTNVATGKTIQYLSKYKEFTPTTSGDGLPKLMKPGDKVSSGGDNPGGDTPGGGGDTPGGEVSGNTITVDFTTMGFGNAEDISSLTLSDGTTLTFSAGENKNGPKYYNSGTSIRMYPKNFFTATAATGKTIAAITLTCSANNAEGKVSANPGTVSVKDMTVTISGVNAATTTVTNIHEGTGAASQLRISKMVITFAE